MYLPLGLENDFRMDVEVVLLLEEILQIPGPHVELRLLEVVFHAVVEDQPHVVFKGVGGVAASVQCRLVDRIGCGRVC